MMNCCPVRVWHIKLREETSWNYSYYPVIFKSEEQLLKIREELNKAGFYPRRYFYPSLSSLDYLESGGSLWLISISERILCLPLFYDIKEEDIRAICTIIKMNYEISGNAALFFSLFRIFYAYS